MSIGGHEAGGHSHHAHSDHENDHAEHILAKIGKRCERQIPPRIGRETQWRQTFLIRCGFAAPSLICVLARRLRPPHMRTHVGDVQPSGSQTTEALRSRAPRSPSASVRGSGKRSLHVTLAHSTCAQLDVDVVDSPPRSRVSMRRTDAKFSNVATSRQPTGRGAAAIVSRADRKRLVCSVVASCQPYFAAGEVCAVGPLIFSSVSQSSL